MAPVLRGDIVWADLDPVRGHEQAGRRPVVVLSPAFLNERSGTVIAMALTSQQPRAGYPFSIELEGVDLPKRSWVRITQIRVLSMQRLGARLGSVSGQQLSLLVAGLNEIVGD
jgi:mRNA interferase MazF